jgi:hypothetical protein
MNYALENLGDERFQQLCQALLAKANPGVQCFPVGQPDGGRDATRVALAAGKREGFLVYQVKFVRDPATKRNPREWLLKVIEDEIDKVQALVDRSATGYFLITNLRGSAHLDAGSIDQMQDLLSEKLELPAICWWRDDIERRLDDAWDIKWAYPEVMTGADFLRAICEHGLTQDLDRRQSALRAFLLDQYQRDAQVKFRQIDLQNRLLDLFVDVPVVPGHTMPSTLGANLFNRVRWIHRRAEAELAKNAGTHSTAEVGYSRGEIGAASFLLYSHRVREFEWVVLEGGPGQGKSTLSQYIAQVHRIRLLGIVDDERRIPRVHAASAVRLPIRVDLRHFAQWLRGEHPFIPAAQPNPQLSSRQLEPFLAALVSYHGGGVRFSVDDLIAVVKISSICLVLDGLDEIADLAARRIAVEEIAAGCQRLSANAASLQVVVTSRPAIFSDSPRLPDIKFAYLTLAPLNHDLIENYVERWGKARRVSGDVLTDLHEFVGTKLKQPHIRELARNPMQLSILLSLVSARGPALPDKRTALYDAYIDYFLAREAEKNVTIREHRELILDLHKYLAWVMHSEAEDKGSRGSIPLPRLMSLLRAYLESQGSDPAIAAGLFKDMVDRVFVLVSRDQGAFEFEVQPLREYFAARFLFDTAPLSKTGSECAGARPDRFAALAQRSYWINVARFFAGSYSKGELQSLIVSLQDLHEDRELGLTNLPAVLATALLSDWVFSQVPKQVTLVGQQLADERRLLRLAANVFSRNDEQQEAIFAPADENVALQMSFKCLEMLDGDLHEAFMWPLASIVKANVKRRPAIVERMLLLLRDATDANLGRRLRIARLIGVLNDLSTEQLAGLRISANAVDVAELFRAGHSRLLESRPELFTLAVDMILRSEFDLAAPAKVENTALSNLAVGLAEEVYGHIMRQSIPLSMRAAIQQVEGSTVQHFAPSGPASSHPQTVAIQDFTKVLAAQLERPVKEWASSLQPWMEVLAVATHHWGERRSTRFLAIVSAGTRAGRKASSRNSDLFAKDQPLCERTRYARISARNNDYWATQFRSANNDEDRLFAASLCLAWCPFETMLTVADEFDALLSSLSAKNWRWLMDRGPAVAWACRALDRRRLPDGAELPPSTGARFACVMAELSFGGLRKQVVTRYLQDVSDPVADRYRLWLAADIARFGQKRWSPDLDTIARVFTGDVNPHESYYLTYETERHVMSRALARQILSHPEKCPLELVYCAEKSMRAHLGARIPTLVEVARKESWFQEPCIIKSFDFN